MPDNLITISVDGKKYGGWTSLNISRSMENLVGTFSLTVSDQDNQKNNDIWSLQTGVSCTIFLDNELLLTGYIDEVTASVGPKSHSISVKGRDKTADLIDCSFVEKPNSWKKVTIKTLADKLSEPFGITAVIDGVSTSTLSKKFPFTVNTNDSVFENLNRKAKELGVLLLSNSKGELVLANSAERVTADTLEYGKNIEEGNVIYNNTERFKNYTVEGQSLYKQSVTTWGKQITIKGSASDEGINRYRPKIIKSTTPLTNDLAQKTANWEALVRAGKSQVVNITVQGFRQSNDALWEMNWLCDIVVAPLYINPVTRLLITDTSLILNENGSFTKLILKREDAFAQAPKKIVKKQNNLGW